MRIALVHERFTEFAGSEAVVEQMARLWPAANIYSPLVKHGIMPIDIESRTKGTILSGLVRKSQYSHLLPALPIAMRHLKVGSPDLLVASHHAFANQVVHATDSPILSYVHTPARWIWDGSTRKNEAGGRAGEWLLRTFATAYRPSDVNAAKRVSQFVANSTAVRERIQTWWGRDARVIHPPVDTEFYRPASSPRASDYYLLAGRIVPYKRPDLAVRAAEAAGVRLVVVGEGRMRAQLEATTGANIQFVGRLEGTKLRALYQEARAVLMPGIEDFGIVPVEAQACGTPVIATDAGGARDSVMPGQTGILLPSASNSKDCINIWSEALRNFEPSEYSSKTIRLNAEKFSRANFCDLITEAAVDTIK